MTCSICGYSASETMTADGTCSNCSCAFPTPKRVIVYPKRDKAMDMLRRDTATEFATDIAEWITSETDPIVREALREAGLYFIDRAEYYDERLHDD